MSTPGMRIQSVRFGEQSWLDIQEEARHEGVSASQFVREAAIARVWFERCRRGSDDADRAGEFLQAARVLEAQELET